MKKEHQHDTVPVHNLVACGALVHQPLKVFILLSSPLECMSENSKTYSANIPTQGPSERC